MGLQWRERTAPGLPRDVMGRQPSQHPHPTGRGLWSRRLPRREVAPRAAATHPKHIECPVQVSISRLRNADSLQRAVSHPLHLPFPSRSIRPAVSRRVRLPGVMPSDEK